MPTTSQQIDAMGSRENPQEEIYRERFRRVKVFSAVSWRSLSGDQKLFHEDFEGGRKSKVFSAFATLRWTAYVGGPETDWIINCPTLQRVDMEKELEKFLNNTGRQFDLSRRKDGQS